MLVSSDAMVSPGFDVRGLTLAQGGAESQKRDPKISELL